MPIHDHAPNAWGRGFLWGGIALGMLVVAAALTHGFGLLRESAATPEPGMLERHGEKIVIPQTSPLRQRIVVAAARAEPVDPTLTLPAMVESDPARTAQVLTPLGGRVVEIKVALGDRVHRGQVLALIDSPDLGQAYDDDAKAADAYKLTQKNLARQEEQLKLGTISSRDLDQARSDDTQAAAELARTRARLATLGVAQPPSTVAEPRQGSSNTAGAAAMPPDTAAARLRLAADARPWTATRPVRSTLLSVRAPVAGSIVSLNIATGNMINDATQPIMTVADLATVWVTAMVAEKDLAAVAMHQEAEVSLSAYPGKVLRGKVLFVSDIIEPDSRRDKLRIAFANPDVALKPNMFATVKLMRGPQSRVVLPTSALLLNNDRTTVFVATAPWTFERRTVTAELDEGQTVALDSGVAPGEQVVVKGGILLND